MLKKNRRKSTSQRIELPVIDDDDDDDDEDDEELKEHESSHDDNKDIDEDHEELEGSVPSQCPSGEHVCDAIKIHKCACVISSSEREKYDLCLVNGRFVLFDMILYHSKNLPELGYFNSGNIRATRI